MAHKPTIIQVGVSGVLNWPAGLGCLSGRNLLVALAVLVAYLLSPVLSDAQIAPTRPTFPTQKRTEAYVAGRLLVRFRPNRPLSVRAAAHSAVGAAVRTRFHSVSDLELVDLPAGKDVFEGIKEYQNNPDVLYAEPDYRVYLSDVPNDPLFSLTWGLQNTGVQNGVAGADIHAVLAWQLSTGRRNVVIGQLDTGIDHTHPDLAGNIYQNTPECNSNGYDNDGNGYINDCNGINVLGDGPLNDPSDYVGHGTHVAGIMGALGNNGIGVAGVNWQVSILPCKFIGFAGGTASGAIQCLDYMAWMKEHGVNIVATNNSWGGGAYSQALYDAIEGQMEDGILFIAAAGNGDIYDNSSDNDANPFYPASFNLPNIIAVAATDRQDNLAWFSNYGLHSVHLGAPGVSVISTFPGGQYQEFSGTSMATPHVTGSAALLQAFNPTLNWVAIRNLLLAGGDSDVSLSSTVTQNRLSVYGAMTCSNRRITAREEPRGDLITTSANVPITLQELNINCADPAGPVQVTVEPSGQIIQLADDGNAPDLAANDGIYSATFEPASPGTYTLVFPNGDNVIVKALVPYTVNAVPSTYVPIVGTNLELSDEVSKTIQTPFPIHFGGQTFDQIHVTDNGLIAMDDGFNTPLAFPLPYPQTGALVAPFWDDLQPVLGEPNNVFWDSVGSAPNRQLVVEWRNVYHYPFPDLPGSGTVTFEVVFHEDRDEVDFNYGTFVPGGPWLMGVDTPEIWLQTSSVEGTQFAYGSGPIPTLAPGTSLVWQLSPAAAPAFAFSVEPPTQTVVPNQLAIFTGTLTASSGSSSPITISCSGTAPPSCSSVAIATAVGVGVPFEIQASSPSVGTYTFQVQALSDDPPQTAHQQTVTLNVVDYAIGAPSPSTLTVSDGGSGITTVNLSATGTGSFNVQLSCTGLPVGGACFFSPLTYGSVTPGATVPVTVTVGLVPGTPLGNYSVRIIASLFGSSGTLGTREQTLLLQVGPSPDFVLSANGPVLPSIEGVPEYGTFSVKAIDGYSGTIAISCAAIPSGPTCIASPASSASFPISGTIEIDPNGAPTGQYVVTLTATSTTKSHSTGFFYTVANPATPFSFFVGQNSSQTVLVGNTSGPFDLIFVPSPGYTSMTQIIPYPCNPGGAICKITPSDTITPDGSPVHLQMTVTVPGQSEASLGGSFSFTLLAKDLTTGNTYPLKDGGVEIGGGNVTINVQDYALAASNTNLALTPGSSTHVAITNNSFNGFGLPVSVACPSPLPPAVTCNLDKPTLSPGDVAMFTFSAGPTAQPSFRSLEIVGTATSAQGQTIQHTLTLSAFISLPTITIDPAAIAVPSGGYANFTVCLNVPCSGFSPALGDEDVFLISCTSPDAGVTCDGPLSADRGLFGITVRTASGITSIGSHPFTVYASADGETISATGTIVMQGPDSLQMVSPNGGEIWGSGTQNIVWKYAGNPGSTVRLDLVNNGSFTQTIAASVPIGGNGGGSYSWQIPDSLVFSESYQVKITSNDNPSISDVSDDPVWIGRGVSIHNPAAGSVILYGGSSNYLSIYVEYGWSGFSQIQFDLYKSGQFVQNISTSQVSGCSEFEVGCVWDSPPGYFPNIVPGTDYSIKATPLADPSRAVFSSGTFTISNTYLTLTSPNGGEIWQPGTTHAITWNWVGQPVSLGGDVQITLGDSVNPETIITPTTPIGSNGSGSYLWSIPADFPASQYYRVGISTFSPLNNENLGGGSAANFAIGNFHTLSITVNGSGTVQTSDNLINCPLAGCSGIYLSGTMVTLIPSANGGVFLGWSGACSGTGNCVLTMNSDLAAIANFAAPTLFLSASPASSSAASGGQAQYTITVLPQGSLNTTIALACSGLPQGAACTFQPNNFTFPTSSVSTVLTITTAARSSGFPIVGGRIRKLLLLIAILIIVLESARAPLRTVPHPQMLRIVKLSTLFTLLIALILIGCGGGGANQVTSSAGNPAGTPTGNYSITISTKVGNLTPTTTVSLIVQ